MGKIKEKIIKLNEDPFFNGFASILDISNSVQQFNNIKFTTYTSGIEKDFTSIYSDFCKAYELEKSKNNVK